MHTNCILINGWLWSSYANLHKERTRMHNSSSFLRVFAIFGFRRFYVDLASMHALWLFYYTDLASIFLCDTFFHLIDKCYLTLHFPSSRSLRWAGLRTPHFGLTSRACPWAPWPPLMVSKFGHLCLWWEIR